MYSGGGVALFDADDDGDLDLYLTGLLEAGVHYRNDGTGTFTDATTEAGLHDILNAAGVGAADLDRDGDQDLVVTGLNERLRLFENTDGRFTEVGVAAGLSADKMVSTSVTFADYDGDGELDFYVGNLLLPDVDPRTTGVLQSAPSQLHRNLGGAHFAEVAGVAGATGANSLTTSAVLTDLDGDGRVDLYVANDFGPLSHTDDDLDLRGTADGNFVAVGDAAHSLFAKSVSAADFDNDGLIDLYIGNFGSNLLFRNAGGGQFAERAAAAGVRLASYRDDAEPVAARVAYDPGSPAEDDRGLATWQARYTDGAAEGHLKTSWAALWLDYDQDGVLDLYVVNGYWGGGFDIEPEGRRQPNVLFHGRGDGTFEDVGAAGGAADRGDGRSAAAGDLDGDGDLDLVVINNGFNFDSRGGRVVILRNDAARGGFVRVHLAGVASNRDGIGARVELVAGGRRQTRWVSGGDGRSSSQRDPHFGVPAGATPTELRVVWPSGAVDLVRDPPVNRAITVSEGTSPP